jgi:hypothetical protein
MIRRLLSYVEDIQSFLFWIVLPLLPLWGIWKIYRLPAGSVSRVKWGIALVYAVSSLVGMATYLAIVLQLPFRYSWWGHDESLILIPYSISFIFGLMLLLWVFPSVLGNRKILWYSLGLIFLAFTIGLPLYILSGNGLDYPYCTKDPVSYFPPPAPF